VGQQWVVPFICWLEEFIDFHGEDHVIKGKSYWSYGGGVGPDDLINLNWDEVVGRYQEGEEAQDHQKFKKADLIILSGEELPRCWIDPHYRDAELIR
jgi:hypothetical protein